MIVDCLTCPERARSCDDCVVTVLQGTGPPQQLASREHRHPTELELDAAESRVVSIFVGAGLLNAGAVGRLCARHESTRDWATHRDTG